MKQYVNLLLALFIGCCLHLVMYLFINMPRFESLLFVMIIFFGSWIALELIDIKIKVGG